MSSSDSLDIECSGNIQEKELQKANQLLLDHRNQEAEESYLQIIKIYQANEPAIYANLAIALKRQLKYDEAREWLEKALRLNANDANLWSNYCNLLLEADRLPEALLAGQKALKIQPDHVNGINNYALALYRSNQHIESLKLYLRGLSICPDHLDMLRSVIRVYQYIGDRFTAYQYAKHANFLQGAGFEDRLNYSVLTFAMGYIDETLALQARLLQDYGESARLLLHQAETYQALGQKENAQACLFKALKLDRLSPAVHKTLCRLVSYAKERQDLLHCLFFEIDSKVLNEDELVHLYDARAHVLHQQKNYAEASYFLQNIVQIKSSQCMNSARKIIAAGDRELAVARAAPLPEANDLRTDTEARQHIFIVGMPRSGSTLIESVLSMNNEVVSLGEVDFFDQALKRKHSSAGHDCNMTGHDVYQDYNKLIDKYVQRIGLPATATAYTDKMLYNYIFVGRIVREIPGCRIIFCYRNALDNILSILRATFSAGNLYASCPRAVAEVLAAHRRIMSDYLGLFPASIIACDYDKIVSSPKENLQPIMNSLGWAWDESYLHPEMSTRAVFTASVNQVRMPIYRTSRGGWRNYKALLLPAIEVLDHHGIDYES